MTLNRFFWELHQSTKFLTCTVFTLDFMFMNLAYQKRLLEKQDWVRFVLTLSDFFYNEPVFLKYVIHVVLSVKTCPKVHDTWYVHIMYILFDVQIISLLSFFLSFPQPCDSCHQNQNKPFYTSRMLLHHYFYHIDNSWHSRCWTCTLS